MNEALKLGLNNAEVLHEISLTWLDLGCYKQVLESLESTIRAKASAVSAQPEKLRQLKQCAMKLKGKTSDDQEVIQQVLMQIKDIC